MRLFTANGQPVAEIEDRAPNRREFGSVSIGERMEVRDFPRAARKIPQRESVITLNDASVVTPAPGTFDALRW